MRRRRSLTQIPRLQMPKKLRCRRSLTLTPPLQTPTYLRRRRSHTHTLTNANRAAATQITHIDASSANVNINMATRVNRPHFRDPFRQRSPLWRAIRRSRKRLLTVADGCRRLRTVAVANAIFGERSPTQSETGTLATHSEKIGQKIFKISNNAQTIALPRCWEGVTMTVEARPWWCRTASHLSPNFNASLLPQHASNHDTAFQRHGVRHWRMMCVMPVFLPHKERGAALAQPNTSCEPNETAVL